MKPDYYAHEALDRTHIIREMIWGYLHDHPYLKKNKKINKKVKKAGKLLNEAYQMIGAKHLV